LDGSRAAREKRSIGPTEAAQDRTMTEREIVHQLKGKQRIARAETFGAKTGEREVTVVLALAQHVVELLHRAARSTHSKKNRDALALGPTGVVERQAHRHRRKARRGRGHRIEAWRDR